MTRFTADDLSKILQRDLRRTCIHEHGHAAVAMLFAMWGRVEIFENKEVNDVAAEKLVGGRFRVYGEFANVHHARMIGLAGTIAEELDDNLGVPGWQIFEWLALQTIELSPSDAELAGEYAEADVEECTELLRGVWSSVDMAARCEAMRFMMEDIEADT